MRQQRRQNLAVTDTRAHDGPRVRFPPAVRKVEPKSVTKTDLGFFFSYGYLLI